MMIMRNLKAFKRFKRFKRSNEMSLADYAIELKNFFIAMKNMR